MFSRIEALRFRALRYVEQELGPFHVLVGPNGSGKTTFLDVIGFLGDLVTAGPSAAVLGDPRLGIASRASDAAHLCWMREPTTIELAVELVIPEERRPRSDTLYDRARYEVAIDVGNETEPLRIAAETLWLLPPKDPPPLLTTLEFPSLREPPAMLMPSKTKSMRTSWRSVVNKVRESGNDYFHAETSNWKAPFKLGPTRSALANLPEDEERFPVAIWVKQMLASKVHRVVLDAQAMRRPSPPSAPRTFVPDGSNLPWVVDALRKSSPERHGQWIEHVRTALPELRDVDTVERPEDRHRYLVVEYASGLKAPAWVVSDGTLRLLALTLLAYAPSAGVFLIEEPENGIHPKAIETIYQSLRSVYDAQVLTASHSPIVLGLARQSEVLCFAKDNRGATDVVRGSDHPRLRAWKGSADLGTLFAAGVLG
jgi:predicted ATPase